MKIIMKVWDSSKLLFEVRGQDLDSTACYKTRSASGLMEWYTQHLQPGGTENF